MNKEQRRVAGRWAICVTAVALASSALSVAPAQAQAKGPIKLLQFGDYQAATGSWPEQLDGAQLGAAAVNASGGINGRKIEIISCNTKGDVNEGARCARDAISSGAIAAVGSQQLNGQGSTKVFEKASMANVAVNPLAPVDFSSPISFPIVSGAATSVAAACAGLVNVENIKSGVIVFGVDLAAGKTARDACQNSLKLRGVDSTVVVAPPGAPDMAPFVAQAMARKPQAVVLSVLPSDIVKITTAFQQAGFKGTYATVASLYSASTTKGLAQTTAGAIVGAKFPPVADTKNPVLAGFHADVKRFKPNVALTEYTLNSYIGVNLIAQVASRVKGDLTKETFLAAMKKAGPVKLPVLGTLDMNKSAGIAGQPRIVNGKAILLRFTGTKFKVLSGFFDPYAV